MAEADVDFEKDMACKDDNENCDDEFGCGEEEDDLTRNFNAACENLKRFVNVLEPDQLLEFYGLYKQATVGPCAVARPGWYAMKAKEKWNAWNKLGGMSRTDAMEKYLELSHKYTPQLDNEMDEGRSLNSGWVAVSSMANSDDHINDEDKTIFDWVKENDVIKIKEMIRGRDVCGKDADGMGLIHWAADRGNLDIMKFLIDDMHTDIEMRDAEGQTALHYAASCGHKDVLKYLVDKGANKFVEDNDGSLPKDVASDKEIESILL